MRTDLGRTEAVVVSDNFIDWKEVQELVPLGQSVRNVSGLRGRGGAWPGGGDDVDSMIMFKPPMLPGHQLVSGTPDFLLSLVFVHRVNCPESNPPRNRTVTGDRNMCFESQLGMSLDPTDPDSWHTVFPPTNDSVGFIPLGNPGDLDSNLIAASQSPFMHPNKSRIQLYYIGNTFGDALPEPADSDSLMLAEIGVDGWAGYSCEANSTATVITTRHVAEGAKLTLVLDCNDADAGLDVACGSASVTVLDGTTAAPLGPNSKLLRPTASAVSAPMDVVWSAASSLTPDKPVVLRIDLVGSVSVYSFTYSA